jgi:hypothetical protein
MLLTYVVGYQQSPVGVAPMGAPYGASPVIRAQDIRFKETYVYSIILFVSIYLLLCFSPVVCTCTFCGNNGPTSVEFINGTYNDMKYFKRSYSNCKSEFIAHSNPLQELLHGWPQEAFA